MPLKYLKIEPEQAVVDLDKLIVSGYEIKNLWKSEYDSLRINDAQPANVPSEKREEWKQMRDKWIRKALIKLEEIYLSQAEVYKFKEVPSSAYINTAYDDHFYSMLQRIQARIDILNSYKDFIFQHSNIQIIAGRDINFQSGGHHNKQEVSNEGQ